MKNNQLLAKILFAFIFLTCFSFANAQYTVQGTVKTPKGFPVKDALVFYDGVQQAVTGADGSYSFSVNSAASLPVSLQYKLPDFNGINTGDNLAIFNHILTRKPLTSVYQLIAADSDQNGIITVNDINNINKIILGINNSFPGDNMYSFFPAGITPDLNNWNTIPHTINTDFSAGNIFIADFKAVKLGDTDNQY